MNCRKSTIQNYECQVTHNNISFDACLAKELFHLWDLGIETNGSCCGRHIDSKEDSSYIGVYDKDIEKMKELRYEIRKNGNRQDSFIPKTI